MIDRQLAGFLEEGLGIHIGTRNDRLEPNGARVTAVKVDEDGVHVLVYVPKVAAGRVLPDLESNGQAAICFARPIDDRACQVKAAFVSARAATAKERRFVAAQWDRFLTHLEQIGIPRAGAANWSTWPSVVIRVKATALFNQTPGPEAGAPVA
jgi:hypothetical protein